MSDQNKNKSVADLSRRNFLGVSSTALAKQRWLELPRLRRRCKKHAKQKKIFLQAIRDKKTSRY